MLLYMKYSTPNIFKGLNLDNDFEIQLNQEKQKHFRTALQDANVEFMMLHEWNWFVTHTFKNDISQHRAWSKWLKWIDKLNRSIYGRAHKKHSLGVVWCCATEFQKRGVIHYHALISGVPQSVYRAEWARQWREVLNCGRSRVDQAVQNAAMIYISKYVAKDSHIEYSDNYRSCTMSLLEPNQS